MRLVWYEWKKLWKNASVLKIFLFFLLLSGIVFWGELDKNREWIPEYLKMHGLLEEEQGGAAEWVEQKKASQSAAGYEQWKALEQIGREVEAQNGYAAYRESIQNRYEKGREISIFADPDSDRNAYGKRIAQAYEKLDIQAPMELHPYLGVEQLLDFYAGDLLAAVFLIYLTGVVFLQEEKAGKSEFALTMFHGNVRLFLAKAFVVYSSLTVYMLLIFVLNFMLASAKFGGIACMAAIQGVPGYYAVPYAWTIGQYLLACMGLKLLAAAVLTALAVAIAKRFCSVILTAAGTACILGLGIWFCNSSVGGGLWEAGRIWNVWSLLRGKPVIGTYELISFGSLYFEAAWGIVPLAAILFGLMLFAGGRRQMKRRRRIWAKKGSRRKPHSIFYFELKKLWVYQRGMILFAACILLHGMTVRQYRNDLDTEEYYYQQYIDRFGDRVTKQTDHQIREEKAYFQSLEETLAGEENIYRADALQRELERRDGFEKYADRAALLQRDGKEEILLKDIQYEMLFGFTEVSRGMVLFLCISFAFLIPAVFQKEKETRVELLQKTSACGGKTLWNAKIMSLLLYFVSLTLVFGMFSFWKSAAAYDLKMSAPSDCLPAYWDSGISIPIACFFSLGVILQCIGVSACLIVLSACGKLVKNQYMLTGMILGATVVPTLLSPYLSLRWLRAIHDILFVFTFQGRWTTIGFAVLLAAAAAVIGKESICREKSMEK